MADIKDLSLVGGDGGGRLKKDLNARHMTMIAIGGSLGIGLLVGTGSALAEAGPASVLIAFALVGIVVYLVMCSVGEIATYIPLSDGFTGYASRYVDPCLGFAVGYTYWFNYLLFTPNQATVASMLMQFWVDREKANPAISIAVFLVLALVLNLLLSVKLIGEFQYWISATKILTTLGLFICLLVIAFGGGPDHTVRGFQYWAEPGAFKAYSRFLSNGGIFQIDGTKGKFVAFISVLITAIFSYLGVELIGVTVGESTNPRKDIPSSIKMTFFRTIVFYLLSISVIGMCVPYNDPKLAFNPGGKGSNTASPFIVAIENSNIRVLPHIINGSFILFVFASGVAGFYIAARTLYGLAVNGLAPKIFAKTTENGNPIYSLLFSSIFSLLAFLNSSASSAKVFGYFVNFVAVLGLLTWITILVTHIAFMRALKNQGISRNELPWKAAFQPYGSYVALIFCIIVIFAKNLTVFLGPEFDYITFITANLGLPLFVFLAISYKFFMKTSRVTSNDADLVTFKDIIDREEREIIMDKELERQRNPTTTWKKVYKYSLGLLF